MVGQSALRLGTIWRMRLEQNIVGKNAGRYTTAIEDRRESGDGALFSKQPF